MAPVIRIDDEVHTALQEEAIKRRIVFKNENAVLREMFNLDCYPMLKRPAVESVKVRLTAGDLTYKLFKVLKEHRLFFPGYKVPFQLDTDSGTVTTWVTSASKGTAVGDSLAGGYLMAELKPWFNTHLDELGDGAYVLFEAVEPGKKYRLSIADSG